MIYHLLEDMGRQLEGAGALETAEVVVGSAEVLQVGVFWLWLLHAWL